MMFAALAALAQPKVLPVRLLPEPVIANLFDSTASTAPAPPDNPVTAALRWSLPVAVTVEMVEGDLIVRYDRPLDAAAVAAFLGDAGDRVARLDWGPDNLVLRGRADLRVDAEARPDGLDVRFATRPADAGAEAPADDAGLVLAQAEAASGYPARARRRIAALAAARPDDPTLQVSLASAEYASGRTEAAAVRYRALPDRGGAAGQIAARAIGPSIDTGVLRRDGRDFDQTEATARVGIPLSNDLRIEAGVRHVRSRSDDPVSSGARRERDTGEGGIALAAHVAPDLRLRLDVTGLLNGDVIGGAFAANLGDSERRATLRLAYHLPDLATLPGALLDGWVDRTTLGGSLRAGPGVVLRLEGGAIRYGLSNGGWQVASVVAEGGIDYLIRRRAPTVTFSYRVDGEYVLDRRGIGAAYAAIANRENHIVQGTIGQPLGERLTLTGAAGWTVNRYGGGGPVASLGLSLVPIDGWEANLIGGVSSISRAGVPARQRFGRLGITRRFGGAS